MDDKDCNDDGQQLISEGIALPSDELVQIVAEEDSNSACSNSDEPSAKRMYLEATSRGQTFVLSLSDSADMFQGETVELENKVDDDEPEGCNAEEDSEISRAWFTSKEDKVNLHDKGHVWKQGMWSAEEIETLQSNITKYCQSRNIVEPSEIVFEMTKDERKDFYRTIAKGLNRPLFSVYRRVIRMYDYKNYVGKYSPEDLERLRELRAMHGNDWQAIGNKLGRSASSIKDRCRLMKDNCNTGKWFPNEENRLAEAVYELSKAVPGETVTSGISWSSVAQSVGTRSEKQCRTKWLNYLNWKQSGGTEWSREDDVALVSRIYALEATDENCIDWMELGKGWPSVRSPQWLRGKWWSLKRYIAGSQSMTFNEICDYLYKHHVLNVRTKGMTDKGTLTCGSSTLPRKLDGLSNIVKFVNIPVQSPGKSCVEVEVKEFSSGELDNEASTSTTYQTMELYNSGDHLGNSTSPTGFLLTQTPSRLPLSPCDLTSPVEIVVPSGSGDSLVIGGIVVNDKDNVENNLQTFSAVGDESGDNDSDVVHVNVSGDLCHTEEIAVEDDGCLVTDCWSVSSENLVCMLGHPWLDVYNHLD